MNVDARIGILLGATYKFDGALRHDTLSFVAVTTLSRLVMRRPTRGR